MWLFVFQVLRRDFFIDMQHACLQCTCHKHTAWFFSWTELLPRSRNRMSPLLASTIYFFPVTTHKGTPAWLQHCINRLSLMTLHSLSLESHSMSSFTSHFPIQHYVKETHLVVVCSYSSSALVSIVSLCENMPQFIHSTLNCICVVSSLTLL